MKDVKIIVVFVLAILLGFTLYSYLSGGKPRVLVLQSYQTDFSWVADIDVSIRHVLEQHNYDVRWHYMDTKNNPSAAFKEQAGEKARAFIDSWNPDILIAIDDNAQEYVGKYYLNDSMKIIFSGLNKTPADYGYDTANNVTGILERIDYHNMKSTLFHLLPPRNRRMIHISDASPTSEGIHDELVNNNWEPMTLLGSVQCRTFDDWKAAITDAAQKADTVLFTHYHTILESSDSDTIVPPQEVLKWTLENSSLMDIGFWGFYVEDGGMLAIGPSPSEQGEEAARMTVDIIENNLSTKEIPVYTNRLFTLYMRDAQSVIKRKMQGLDLSVIYDAAAVVANREQW